LNDRTIKLWDQTPSQLSVALVHKVAASRQQKEISLSLCPDCQGELTGSHGRMAWQKASGYNQRSRGETLMGCWKAIVGPRLKARAFENRKTEATIGTRVGIVKLTGDFPTLRVFAAQQLCQVDLCSSK
jgi:hypothetical protein